VKEGPVFENLKTFEDWDRDYYPARARRYYDRAIGQMLRCLEAKPEDLVLDAGCGPGEHAVRVARNGHRVLAIDFSAAVLGEARRRAHAAGLSDRIQFERGDLTGLGFADASFDRVFSWGVVIHIPQVELALAELARIVRPGGRLALYVTNEYGWDYPIIDTARRLRRRPAYSFRRTALGEGCWYEINQGRLWVWRMDVDGLTRHMASLGLIRTQLLPGVLTELHVRLRGAARTPLLWLNDVWYAVRAPARPCVTNLLVFRKQH
jgi:SAM-dependent methyltransferase